MASPTTSPGSPSAPFDRWPIRYVNALASLVAVVVLLVAPLSRAGTLVQDWGWKPVLFVAGLVLAVGWLPVFFRRVGSVVSAVVLSWPLLAVFTLIPILILPFTVAAWLTVSQAFRRPTSLGSQPPPPTPSVSGPG